MPQIRSKLSGNTLNLLGTSGNDRFEINYGSSTSSFAAVVNGITQSFTATTINIDGLAGADVADITLSSLVDEASFAGSAGTITSQNYTINLVNLETKIARGNALDSAVLNDTGSVQTSYLLPVYAIMQDTSAGVSSQAIGSATTRPTPRATMTRCLSTATPGFRTTHRPPPNRECPSAA